MYALEELTCLKPYTVGEEGKVYYPFTEVKVVPISIFDFKRMLKRGLFWTLKGAKEEAEKQQEILDRLYNLGLRRSFHLQVSH